MALGKEIITLQLGHYSNYVGAHWWNLQEAAFSYTVDSATDINNDVLFREGQTSRGGVTFTPRLVLTDLKGSLGTLREDGGLYEDCTDDTLDHSAALWPKEKVILDVAAPIQKNEFLTDLEKHESKMTSEDNGEVPSTNKVRNYNLEGSVRVWSDYLRMLFHPRTLAITNRYRHGDEAAPFNSFGQGTALWNSPTYQEDFTERVRQYMEEADNLQGFHVLLDGHDGFSGLSCSCLQYLRDEYTTKSVMAFLCLPASVELKGLEQANDRLVNLALTVSSLPDISSLFSPLSVIRNGWRKPAGFMSYPHLKYNPELDYHSSAILAAGLETLTVGYRLRSDSWRLADLTSGLRVVGRAAVSSSVTLPFPMSPGSSLLETLEQWDGPLFHSMTPSCQIENVDFQAISLRGIRKDRDGLLGVIPNGADLSNPAYSCRSPEDMLRLFMSFTTSSESTPASQIAASTTSVRVNQPFPQIFEAETVADEKGGVPVLAGLHSCRGLGESLQGLHSDARRIARYSLRALSDSGLEFLDWQEKLEHLLCLSECYTETG